MYCSTDMQENSENVKELDGGVLAGENKKQKNGL